MNDIDVVGEYLPTNLTYLDYLYIPVKVFIIAVLIVAVAFVIKKLLIKIGFYVPNIFSYVLFAMISSVSLMGLLAPFGAESATNQKNFDANIMKVYDIDEIDYQPQTHTGSNKLTAYVYKGDTAYHVIVKENPETFEPTLISFENNSDISELKR